MLLLLCLLISFFCFWVLKENNGSLSATYVTWPARIDCRFDSEGSLSSQGRKHGRPSQDKHLSLIQLARAPRVALQFIRGYHRPPFHRNGGDGQFSEQGKEAQKGTPKNILFVPISIEDYSALSFVHFPELQIQNFFIQRFCLWVIISYFPNFLGIMNCDKGH